MIASLVLCMKAKAPSRSVTKPSISAPERVGAKDIILDAVVPGSKSNNAAPQRNHATCTQSRMHAHTGYVCAHDALHTDIHTCIRTRIHTQDKCRLTKMNRRIHYFVHACISVHACTCVCRVHRTQITHSDTTHGDTYKIPHTQNEQERKHARLTE